MPEGDTGTPLLDARTLSKVYGDQAVLRRVDFTVHRGERICIVGPSGSGKTTLLRCLNLLVEPSAGTLTFAQERIGEWPGRIGAGVDICRYRSRIGMVFQHFELFPHLTALDNITLGPRRVLGEPRQEAEARARALLQRIGLESHALAKPSTLSGGQKQRVAIARALAMRPELVLFDEPTSALDAEMVGEVLTLIRQLANEGLTMVVVTHELRFARDVASRMVFMEGGRIIEQGPPSVLFESPREERTRTFLQLRGAS
jgi:polar amino acid transport system ATP-binding protein